MRLHGPRNIIPLIALVAPMFIAASCHLAAGLDDYERSGAAGVGGGVGGSGASSQGGSGGTGGAGGSGGSGVGGGGVDVLWAYPFGNSLRDNQPDVAVLNSDNTVLVGVFNGQIQFGAPVGGITATVPDSGFIAVQNPLGDPVIAGHFDGTIAAPKVATDGIGVAVVGQFTDALALPGTNNVDITADGGIGNAAFVTAINQSGDAVWAERIGESNTPVFANGVAVGDGRVCTVGAFTGTIDFNNNDQYSATMSNDSFVACFDSNDGSVLWTDRGDDINTTNTDLQVAVAVGMDGSGNSYVAGHFEDAIRFEDTTEVDPTGIGLMLDIFLAKYDRDGSLGPVIAMGGAGDDAVTAMAVNTGGDILLAGSYTGTLQLPAGPSLPASGVRRLWLARVRNTLQVTDWAVASEPVSDNTTIEDIVFLRDANLSVGIIGVIDGELTLGSNTFNSNAQGDVFFAVLDGSTTEIRAAGIAGDGDPQFGRAIAATAEGAAIAGEFQGQLDFGGGTTPMTAMGADFDIFLARFAIQ